MSTELSILALYGFLIIVTIVIQVVLALPQLGLGDLATPRDEGRQVHSTAARAQRCLDNSVVAMALFAPAILILQAKGISTSATLLAAQIFLIARAAYLVIYRRASPGCAPTSGLPDCLPRYTSISLPSDK